MPIYIRGEDDETLAKLRDMGFDAQVISDDPTGDLIFYAARMNAKLDNLGQLRHLHKMMQSMLRIRSSAEEQQKYYERLNREADAKQLRLKTIYKRMYDATDLPENEGWRKTLPPFVMLNAQTERDVFRVFQAEVDENYFLYAIQDGLPFIKGVQGEAVLLPTKRGGNNVQIRLMDL